MLGVKGQAKRDVHINQCTSKKSEKLLAEDLNFEPSG